VVQKGLHLAGANKTTTPSCGDDILSYPKFLIAMEFYGPPKSTDYTVPRSNQMHP
jgi:hypothetical protein